MKLSRIWILFSVGLLSFSVFIIFLSFYLLIITSITSESPESDDKIIPKRESYLYQEFDPSSNDVSRGFITLRESLSDDEFLSYTSPNGNQIIISTFASTQYECQGACFCSSEKRRTSPNLISLPLFLVISAISTSLAIKIAEKTFNNQCALHFSSECDEENIHSSVTSCSEKEEKESPEEEKEYAEYSCEGYCIKNKQIRARDGLAAQKDYLEETGGCEKLKTSGSVRTKRKINEKIKAMGRFSKRTGEVKEYPHRYADMYQKAQIKFSVDYLTSFCKEMSQKEYWYYPENQHRQRRKAFMCIGGGNQNDFPDERLDNKYQNIRCVMTSESNKKLNL